MTKAELLSLLAEFPLNREIKLQMTHIAEVGDLLDLQNLRLPAVPEHTVILIGDPHWNRSAYNTEADEGGENR